MNQNPMQMMQQFNQFRQQYRGNAKEEAMRRIQQSNLSQSQLNELQNTANMFYSFAKNMGIIK